MTLRRIDGDHNGWTETSRRNYVRRTSRYAGDGTGCEWDCCTVHACTTPSGPLKAFERKRPSRRSHELRLLWIGQTVEAWRGDYQTLKVVPRQWKVIQTVRGRSSPAASVRRRPALTTWDQAWLPVAVFVLTFTAAATKSSIPGTTTAQSPSPNLGRNASRSK